MKKIIVICAASLSIAMFACHKKAVPTVADRTEIPPAPSKPAAPIYAAADVEAGKAIYSVKCARCHPAKDATAYTTVRWEGILRSMIPKAKLNDEESRQVTAYAMVNAKKE
jgi:mono/diheme cytochrome c family protein